MFGQQFRKLRKSRMFTLKELVTPNLSMSTIARFEREQQDLGIAKVNEMCRVMNVSLGEWISSIDTHTGRSQNFSTRIMKMYLDKDTHSLHQEFQIIKQKYTLNPANATFVKLAMIANYYFDLTGKRLLNKKSHSKLIDMLFSIEKWNENEIALFGDSVALLSNKQLFLLEKEIIKHLSVVEKHNYLSFLDSWTALLNGYIILIQHDVASAAKIQSAIMSIDLPARQLSLQIRRYMINEILNYRLAQDEQSQMTAVSKIIRTTSFLNDVGDTAMAKQELDLFASVKHENPKDQ